jgi:hypothetical protein
LALSKAGGSFPDSQLGSHRERKAARFKNSPRGLFFRRGEVQTELFNLSGGTGMQIILKYVADAVNFRHLAALEKNPEAKARLEKQAAAYLKLATDRAKKIGVPPPKIPDDIKQ